MGRPRVNEPAEDCARVRVGSGLRPSGVALTAVRPRHFGGPPQVMFLCPRCEARRWVLYLRDGAYACARCHRLSFRTQRLAPEWRLLARRNRLLARLGVEGLPEGWETIARPRGMKRRRFARLLEAARDADRRALEAARRRWGGDR